MTPAQPPHPRRLGLLGEAAARAELERCGYEILQLNFHCRGGEADLVARQGETLVFVEVKTRRELAHGLPGEAVQWRKRQRLVAAAEAYCARLEDPPPCRFDIVEVVVRRDEVRAIRILPDAFLPGE